MAKKKAVELAGVIPAAVRHKGCGWISQQAFMEGASCPKCGERLSAGDVQEVTNSALVEDEDE